MLRFSELLNQVWGLEGCPLKGQTMRKHRSVRFVYGGSTVLVGSSGHQVSFNTTVGVWLSFYRKTYRYIKTRNFDSADKPRFTTQLLMCAA